MKREDAKQHIEQIRRDKFGISADGTKQPNALERDLRAALKNLAEELNAKETHFILELLQNAEDNTYPAGVEPELSISVEVNDPTETGGDGCLYLLNNEVGFTHEQVWSLCSVGQSTKNKARGYIGEKGIGFKSVFRVSDQPHIFSNGYQFCFQKPNGLDELGYIVPRWVDFVPDVVRLGFTGIFLPLVAGKRSGIAEKLRAVPPETILFLTQLRRLGIGQGHFVARDKTSGVVKLSADAAESLYFVHRRTWPKPNDLVEDKRVGINEREVTVALPLKSTRPCSGRVFAFLPTELDTGLPFLVNADFLLSASRDSLLDDRRWNQWLRDKIAPTFVEAFLSVLNEPEWKADAYRFLPLASDLTPGSEFFVAIVGAIQSGLQVEQCMLTKTGDYVLPKQAHFAGPLASRILRDAPPERATVALLHPDLDRHWERLKPLGVKTLEFVQLFDMCNDDAWLKSRDNDWWETLWELCAKCDVSAETVGSFPILRCRDGICRPLSSGIFSNAEEQPAPTGIPSDWPAAHLLDADLQKRVQLKPAVWAWLVKVAGLRPFAVQSYITNKLLDWMRQQTGEHLIEATRFIAANLKHLDTPTRQTLREKMTWLLADGKVLHPEARVGREVITPECLENDIGWNLLFCALDRHFFVIHDEYCAGLSGDSLAELREMFKACGATAFPDPRLREMNPGDPHYNEALVRCANAVNGTPKLRDWAAPGWLLGLENVEQTANGQRKVEALERWLKALGPDYAKKLLHCSKPDFQGDWQQINAWSEFGGALHTKPWMRTTQGYVAPPTAYLDTPEFREFFGDSVAYVKTDIATPLLEKLGVRVHLTAEVLIGQLRTISGSENPDPVLLAKIYRRLQDSTFDVNLFRREKLIFLSEPKPRWLSTERLVWEDAVELFDDDFGYVSLTYGKSELHRFFTETLKIPVIPELRHYATAWKSLCFAATPDRSAVERKLKVILTRLADSQNELSNSDWWHALRPQLRVWTLAGEFQPPARVYLPDHSVAVELFAGEGRIHVAFPPKPSRTVLSFLRWMSCPSLASAVQTRLAETIGESTRTEAAYLTLAAKKLCVFLVCSHQGWQDRRSPLLALLETAEVGVTAITVEYSLRDNLGAGTQPQSRDAYWDISKRRLLLRDGVDSESLRGAAAKSIAAEFFGEAASTAMQADFFFLLTVLSERARQLEEERNWRLTPEQQEWLPEQYRQIFNTELDEVEQPPAPRTLAIPLPVGTTATPPVDPNSQTNFAVGETAATQTTSSTGNQAAPATPGHAGQETPRADSPTTSHAQETQTQSANDAPIELHDAETMSAEVIPVRAHIRSRTARPRREQTDGSRRETESGLTSTSAEDKAALERCGRQFAAKQLEKMGYTKVEPMGPQNPGFDLRAFKPGDTLKVEVKSHAREASSVFVSQREYEEYLTTLGVNGETWELWNVENLAKSSGKSPTIQRVGQIPESAMKESGYWVNLSQCSQEPPTAGTADP